MVPVLASHLGSQSPQEGPCLILWYSRHFSSLETWKRIRRSVNGQLRSCPLATPRCPVSLLLEVGLIQIPLLSLPHLHSLPFFLSLPSPLFPDSLLSFPHLSFLFLSSSPSLLCLCLLSLLCLSILIPVSLAFPSPCLSPFLPTPP